MTEETSSFEDQSVACGDCSKEFTFTAGEQEFFAQKGFSVPKRCPECRQNAKNRRRKNFY